MNKKQLYKKYIIALFGIMLINLTPFSPSISFEKGDDPPNIFGQTLNKEYFKLSSVDMPAVVNFFAYHCIPCQKELPEIAKLEKQFPNINFIAVHVDNKYQIEDIQNFIDKKLNGEIVSTVIKSSQYVMKDYGFDSFPHTVFLDSNGLVFKEIHGYNSNTLSEFEEILLKLK